MSRHYTIKPAKFTLRFEPSERASAYGGQLAIAAVLERFKLWKRVKRVRALDPRRHLHKGYDPCVYVAAILFSLTSGGCTLSDVEQLNEDEALKAMLGIKRFPDATSVGEWLRHVGMEGAQALRGIVREFVEWSLAQAEPARYEHLGQVECFFDDTQLEVNGPSFEGAAINYEGKLALGWQTLWVGPFLVDGVLGTAGEDVSSQLPALLETNQDLWSKAKSHLYADSASSAGKYLKAIARHFDSWTVSYNKWTDPLEGQAHAFPQTYWSEPRAVKGRKGEAAVEQYAWLRYQPEGCDQTQLFAVARRRAQGEMFWNFSFLNCSETFPSAQGAFERHHLKGDRERLFSDVLSDLDLHHPPCAALSANRVYYALAMLAYDVLQALKLIWLPPVLQAARVRTLLKHLLMVPVEIKRHARALLACFYAPAQWIAWWRRFLGDLLPRCQLASG
jgi:hypothetical protein